MFLLVLPLSLVLKVLPKDNILVSDSQEHSLVVEQEQLRDLPVAEVEVVEQVFEAGLIVHLALPRARAIHFQDCQDAAEEGNEAVQEGLVIL